MENSTNRLRWLYATMLTDMQIGTSIQVHNNVKKYFIKNKCICFWITYYIYTCNDIYSLGITPEYHKSLCRVVIKYTPDTKYSFLCMLYNIILHNTRGFF